MHRALLFAFLACTPASAQLVVSAPASAPCPLDSRPVIGVALHTVMGGTYGTEFPDDLQRGLEQHGFRVVPEFSWPLIDLASIGIKGEVNHWENHQGQQSVRVGKSHIVIYDLDTKKTLFNLDQNPATWVFGAPQYQDFVGSVVKIISEKFCQAN